MGCELNGLRVSTIQVDSLVNVAPRPTFTNPRDSRFSADWANVIIDKIEVIGSSDDSVPPSNNPPIAVDDVAGVSEDGTVSIPVLANDSDPDGDTLRVSAVSRPQNGNAIAASNGTITYVPQANFSGTDTFAYTVNDGRGGENTPRVTVSVAAVNDPPIAQFSVTPNTGTAPLAVTFDARTSSDLEEVITTYAWNFGDGSTAFGATARRTYAASGTYTARLTVTDAGGLSATRTATISVAAPPPPPSLSTVTVVAQDNVAIEGHSNQGVFRIQRSGGSLSTPQEVSYTVGGSAKSGTDYGPLSGVAIIPAGASSIDVALVPVNDDIREGEENVQIVLKAQPAYRLAAPARATIRLLDDETPSVSVVATDAVASERGTNPGVFTIERMGPLTSVLTVNYTMSGTATSGVDYTGPTGSVTFAVGKSSIAVPIRPIADNSPEAQETATLTLQKRPSYQIGEFSDATVSIEE